MFKGLMRKYAREINNLLADRSGNILMFLGLGMMALVGATGIAIDMSRLQTARAKLSSALDAAGLAAGSKAHSADVLTVVNNYLAVNYPAGFMDSTITDVNVTINDDYTVITVSATADVNMTFMKLFGQNIRSISATSEVTRENRGLELAMVLDITGSMAGSKIIDLRTAATDMVNILYGQKETIENLWVSIVPYVTNVNIGNTHTNWIRNYSLSDYPANYPSNKVKWKGCVEARGQYPDMNGLDLTDDIPEPAKPETLFPKYFWASASDNKWIKNNGGMDYSDTSRNPNLGCGNEVTPLRADKTTLLNAVTALNQVGPYSGTMTSEGLAWGWRMISPKWRGLWNATTPDLPLDYNTPLMSKAIIIMTDGINEVVSSEVSGVSTSHYTGYRRIHEQRLGANVNTPGKGVTAVNNKFTALCNAIKAKGIIIYAVTFQLGTSTAHNNARTMFRNCASKPDYYFDSPDGETLKKSFRQIGDSLANLMISR
jgi:Flp pilus assembly protein TadG